MAIFALDKIRHQNKFNMEIKGKVIQALPIEGGTSNAGNPWQKREFVIETPGQYPKKICFLLFGDKVNECPQVGETVKVSFDIESREWNTRWFTNLNAWKIERQAAPNPYAPNPQQAPQVQQQAAPAQQADDLPF